MKRFSFFALALAMCLVPLFSHAQNYMWGMTSKGGAGYGTIFRTNEDGTGYSLLSNFGVENIGSTPKNVKLLSYGGMLYGVTSAGGEYDAGVLFEYNPLTAIYTKKYDFNPTTGSAPIGSLTLFNGVFYGMTSTGGINGLGVLYSYDVTTSTYTKRVDFNGTINGSSPEGMLTVYGTKLFGMTKLGGTSGLGTLFEFNPTTFVLTKKIDFIGTTNGSRPVGSLTVSGTKLFGVTSLGGANGVGCVFDYVPLTGVLTKRNDFETATLGSGPSGTLVLYGGLMYGTTKQGGLNSRGTVFEYNPTSYTLVKKNDFNNTNGSFTQNGALLVYGTSLYGLSLGGGTGEGVIFEFIPSTGALNNKISMGQATIGGGPMGELIEAGGKFYGTCSYGLGNGTLFEYDPVSNTATKKIGLNLTPKGTQPKGSLVVMGTKFYGMTATSVGNNGVGTLFEFDPSTNGLIKLHTFTSTVSQPYGTLIVNGNSLYGMSLTGGTLGGGILFKYTPSTSTLTVLYNFDNNSNGAGKNPVGDLFYYNEKMYGLTRAGGTSGLGVLFEFDPITLSYSVKANFSGTSNGSSPYGSLIEDNGLLYGLTSAGGTNDHGTLFEYNTTTSTLTKKADFLATTTGSYPKGSIEVFNSKFYVTTSSGGANSMGTVAEYDPSTEVMTKKADLSVSLGGISNGTFATSNSKLYAMSYYYGTNNLGTLFEFDPATSAIATKIDFNNSNGATPEYTRLLVSPVPLPVQLLYLKAKQLENANQLTWATASEKNNSIFNIERSVDGLRWSTIGTVDAVGNSSVTQTYTFEDSKQDLPPLVYYRIKQVDVDKKFAYSEIVSVTNSLIIDPIVFPNPCRDKITIQGQANKATTIELYSPLGICVKKETRTSTDIVLGLEGLSKGQYSMKIKIEEEVFIKKIVIE